MMCLMSENRFLFILIIVFLLTNFIIVIANNGLRLEIGGSIDVHHHTWFVKHIINTGHFPSDQAFEYMPNALSILAIISIITGSNSTPAMILIRNLSSNIIYVMFIYILIKRSIRTFRISIKYLIIIPLCTLPMSFGLMPSFLTVNVFPCLVFSFIYIVTKFSTNIVDARWIIIYLMLVTSMLLSNFSYMLIVVMLISLPALIKIIYFKNNSKIKISISLSDIKECFYKRLLIFLTVCIVLFYIIYVIVDLRTKHLIGISNLLEKLFNILKGEDEIVTVRTNVLTLVEKILVAFKLWGFLIFPYFLMTFISIVDLLISYVKNTTNRYIDAVNLFTITSLPVIILTPWLGYDTFRIVNIINLLIPLNYVKLVNELDHLIRNDVSKFDKSFSKVLKTILNLTVLLIIIITYFVTATYALPQGYNVLNPHVPMASFINNNKVELVASAEYFSPPLEFYVSMEPLVNLIHNVEHIVCDRSICHSFLYFDRKDLYTNSKSMSESVKFTIEKMNGINYITSVEIRDSLKEKIFVLICSEPGRIMTEEPVEYRSLEFRLWMLSKSSILCYNSYIICVFIW